MTNNQSPTTTRPARAARALAVVAAIIAVMSAACGGTTRAPLSATPAGWYLSLGDSVAAGNGASDPATTSFVALIAHDQGYSHVLNLAKAGATTQDVIDTQLPDAIAAIDREQPGLITISAGGNDLAALIPNAACVQDPLPPACPLDAALAGVARNLDIIMSSLRAHTQARILLLAYPNFFSHTGHPFEAPAARVLPRLAQTLHDVAARYPAVAVVDAAPAFEGHGDTLTHVLDPKFDPHPNDAGHRAIADAFLAALRAGSSGD